MRGQSSSYNLRSVFLSLVLEDHLDVLLASGLVGEHGAHGRKDQEKRRKSELHVG